MKKIKYYHFILLALLIAIPFGYVLNNYHDKDIYIVDKILAISKFIGDTFITALKMIIVPLIFSSIVTGISSLGENANFGRMGIKTLFYYLSTSFFSILIGLIVVNSLKPGLVDGKPNTKLVEYVKNNEKDFSKKGEESSFYASKDTENKNPLGVVGSIIERMVPSNIVKSASNNGQMLSLIFISLLVGFGLIKTKSSEKNTLISFFRGLNDISIQITQWIMLVAPIGIFFLITHTVGTAGLDIIKSMLKFFFTVIFALAIHFFIILPLLLKFVGRVNPIKHYFAMKDALLTAFSTASSSATLPITMRNLQENAGVSKKTAGFVLPLGATVNMDGTALYECIAVLFIAQVLGHSLDFSQQLIVVVIALLTSIGVAGVPSASLVAIVIIVNNVGIPNSAPMIGAIYSVDRLLDMCRTAVNIYSDSCGAVIIAKSEGEKIF